MKEENKNSDSLISLFETEKSLTITLLRARESLMMSFRPLLAKHNFTEQQWRVLRVLGEKGPCDAGQLAAEACILSPSLSRIINTLIENKFIIKKEDKLDEELKQIGINGHLLQSTTEVYQGTPRKNTAQFEGYTVFYGVYRSSHFQLVQDHLNREQRNYLIMLHAIEKRRNALKAINKCPIFCGPEKSSNGSFTFPA